MNPLLFWESHEKNRLTLILKLMHMCNALSKTSNDDSYYRFKGRKHLGYAAKEDALKTGTLQEEPCVDQESSSKIFRTTTLTIPSIIIKE